MTDIKINNSLIEILNNIIENSTKFDNNISQILSNQNNDIKLIHETTNLYIKLRSFHGKAILLQNKISNVTEVTNDEELYNISSFNSIMHDINTLISNIDFSYKKIAIKFPVHISAKKNIVVLVTDNKDQKYIDWIQNLKSNNKDISYEYAIIEVSEDIKKLVNLKKIINKNISVKLTSIPSIIIINGDVITEIDLNKITDLQQLEKQLL